MTGIVERLRRPLMYLPSNAEADAERRKAADEIERLRFDIKIIDALREQNAELVAALTRWEEVASKIQRLKDECAALAKV